MRLKELALFTDDVESVAAFYRELLGIKPSVSGPGIAIFKRDGYEVLVHENYEPGPDELPCEDHVAFEVDDLDATWDRLIDAGLEPLAEPRQWDWGRSAYLRDPDGRIIELQAKPGA